MKYNKEIIKEYTKYLDNEEFKVYVLDDEKYFNIHVISDRFKDEELNTLQLQEPKESVNKDYFSTQRLITYLMDFFMWDRFYNELQNEDYLIYTTLEKQ